MAMPKARKESEAGLPALDPWQRAVTPSLTPSLNLGPPTLALNLGMGH